MMTLHFLNDVASDADSTKKSIIMSKTNVLPSLKSKINLVI